MCCRRYIMAVVWMLLLSVLPSAAIGQTLHGAASSQHDIDTLERIIRDRIPLTDTAAIRSYALRTAAFIDSAKNREEYNTQRFYDTLRARADRSRFWKLVYDLVIVPDSGPVSIFNSEVVDETALYSVYDGKTIDSIEFVRYNVFDPARSYLEKGANAVHVVTRVNTIRRDMLFTAGDVFDADVVVRCKQLLRSRPYIADADIEVIPAPDNPNAVILRVITHDNWSISADGSARGLSGQVKGILYDANFLGTGDRLSYQLSLDWRNKKYEGSQIQYSIPNLLGTFYEATINAGRSFTEKYYGAKINKRFILRSDYEVGAIVETVGNALYVRYDMADEHVDASYLVRYDNMDLWGGRSWYLPDIHSSVYFMARLNDVRYKDAPKIYEAEETPVNPPELDVNTHKNPYFYDRVMMLASFGFYKERFLTTNLIYGYGYDEYIPIGYKVETTFGYRSSIYNPASYGGLSMRAGGFIPIGYLMGDVSIGTFYDFQAKRAMQSALNVKVSYFTNLLGAGRFKVRQFASGNYLNGWNRLSGYNEAVWFTNESGPREISGSPLGTNRLVLSTETVVFTPWEPLGFRIALYAYGDVGFLGYDRNVFNNQCFTTIGMGMRLKNERLVFGTIQLSFFVNFNKFGPTSSEWIQLTSEQRIQATRYIPSKPDIISYQ